MNEAVTVRPVLSRHRVSWKGMVWHGSHGVLGLGSPGRCGVPHGVFRQHMAGMP